jgi:hypothetical protein
VDSKPEYNFPLLVYRNRTKSAIYKGKAVTQYTNGGAGGEEYSSYSFRTSTLDGVQWSASRPDRALPPGKRALGTHWTGGWVGPRAGLDTQFRGKILLPLPGIEPRSTGHPVRNQTLHWLSYPGSTAIYNTAYNYGIKYQCVTCTTVPVCAMPLPRLYNWTVSFKVFKSSYQTWYCIGQQYS